MKKISQDPEHQSLEVMRALIETVTTTPEASMRYLEDMLKRRALDVKE